MVVNDEGVVLVLRADRNERPDHARAEEAMRPGPSTFRPHVPIGEMADDMTEYDLDDVPITTSDGRLVGCTSPTLGPYRIGENGSVPLASRTWSSSVWSFMYCSARPTLLT